MNFRDKLLLTVHVENATPIKIVMEKFCERRVNQEIHKNIIPQKFGAMC